MWIFEFRESEWFESWNSISCRMPFRFAWYKKMKRKSFAPIEIDRKKRLRPHLRQFFTSIDFYSEYISNCIRITWFYAFPFYFSILSWIVAVAKFRVEWVLLTYRIFFYSFTVILEAFQVFHRTITNYLCRFFRVLFFFLVIPRWNCFFFLISFQYYHMSLFCHLFFAFMSINNTNGSCNLIVETSDCYIESKHVERSFHAEGKRSLPWLSEWLEIGR